MRGVEAYPLHWPEGWSRTATRMSSRFDTTLPKALDNVEHSLQLFAADSGKKISDLVISSNYSLASRNPAEPGVAVYFTWDGISTCIAVDRYKTLEENLQAIHHVIEAERTKLRHGGLNLVRAAFRGYAALPPPSSAKSPYEVLGVSSGASKEEIDAAYRRKAKEAHPDSGGSIEAMQELNAARQKLKGVAA